jgi:hypothetical protein
VFRAATDGLYRGPHIFVCLHQVPACSKKLVTANFASVINALRTPCFQVSEHLAPRYISITINHCVRRTPLERLLREKSRVDASVHHPSATVMCESSDLIPAQSIASMHADSNHVARLNCLRVQCFERFIYQ